MPSEVVTRARPTLLFLLSAIKLEATVIFSFISSFVIFSPPLFGFFSIEIFWAHTLDGLNGILVPLCMQVGIVEHVAEDSNGVFIGLNGMTHPYILRYTINQVNLTVFEFTLRHTQSSFPISLRIFGISIGELSQSIPVALPE